MKNVLHTLFTQHDSQIDAFIEANHREIILELLEEIRHIKQTSAISFALNIAFIIATLVVISEHLV